MSCGRMEGDEVKAGRYITWILAGVAAYTVDECAGMASGHFVEEDPAPEGRGRVALLIASVTPGGKTQSSSTAADIASLV